MQILSDQGDSSPFLARPCRFSKNSCTFRLLITFESEVRKLQFFLPQKKHLNHFSPTVTDSSLLTPAPRTEKQIPLPSSHRELKGMTLDLISSSVMDSGLLLFNCSVPRRPCVPSLISCISALPSTERFTGVTMVEDIWPIICMTEKDKWLSPFIHLFILSPTIPEKDWIREGGRDSSPFSGKFLGKTILTVPIWIYVLLNNCLWSYLLSARWQS